MGEPVVNSDDRINLREHLDQIIRIKFKAQEQAVEQRFNAHDKALELAAGELGRRLEILNHAHQQAMEVQRTFVPRELHETTHIALERRIASLEKSVWAIGGMAILIAISVPIVISVIHATR